MEFTAKVQNNKIVPIEQVYYTDEIRKFEGKEVRVELIKLNTRTNPQNKYYWGVVIYMIRQRLEDLGWESGDIVEGSLNSKLTRDDVHEFLKAKFNKKEIVNKETGEVIGSAPQSTTDLSTDEFKDYIDAIIRFAADYLDLNIPDPTPFTYTL